MDGKRYLSLGLTLLLAFAGVSAALAAAGNKGFTAGGVRSVIGADPAGPATRLRPGSADLAALTENGAIAASTGISPTVVLTKTVGVNPDACASTQSITIVPGTEVNYCYTLTNTGTVTVSEHSLIDDQLGTLLNDDPYVLPPGATRVFSQTAQVIDDVTNEATWTAGDGLGNSGVAVDTAQVDILLPSISLQKTVGVVPAQCALTSQIQVVAGTDVIYCFKITNTGQVTVTKHTLTDSQLGLLLNNSTIVVPPGQTHTHLETEQINQTVTNNATWVASDPFNHGTFDNDSATVTVVGLNANLSKTLSSTPGVCGAAQALSVAPGSEVTYCFTLSNDGTTILQTQTLTDTHLDVLLNNESITINPGASHIITQTATITQPVTNVALWTTTDNFNNTSQSGDSATVGITGVTVVLTKTVSAVAGVCAMTTNIQVLPGSSVTYCYEVENTGQVALVSQTLVDSALGTLIPNSPILLNPGATYVFSTTVVINQSVTNLAAWTGLDQYGNPAVDNASATVTTLAPDIDLIPSSLSSTQDPGSIVNIPLTVHNAGTLSLSWNAVENLVPGGVNSNPDGVISNPVFSPSALGDELFRIEAGVELPNTVLLGVEFANGHFWMTAGGVTAINEANLLYELDADGQLLNTYTQPTPAANFGWRDLAFDGVYLYGSDGPVIDQIDPATGQVTGLTIPIPLSLARGIAYDPASGNFWITGFDSPIYQLTITSTVVISYPDPLPFGSIYGIAWDDVSPGGPFLWAWTSDSPPKAVQIDPATGLTTGVTFSGSSLPGASNTGGGATITAGLLPDKLVFVAMHQASADTVIGYDLGVATGLCSANGVSWLSLSQTSGVTAADQDTVVTVTFDSTGLADGTYSANLCFTSNDPDEPLVVVPVTLSIGQRQIFLPIVTRD